MKKILFVQFANSMYPEQIKSDSSRFWDEFYRVYEADGYWRPKYSFELPKWIAEVSHLVRGESWDKNMFWCLNSSEEAVREISEKSPDWVLMSLMDANKKFIREIVSRCPGTSFIIGGYNPEEIRSLERDFPNVTAVESVQDEARIFGVPYEEGTDYSLFSGDRTIPRLTLSEGCLCACKFCIVPHGRVVPKPESVIFQQIESFRDLKFKLVYIDDKTFGQCENWAVLESAHRAIRAWNPEFEGFIVQTRPGEILKNCPGFARAGVKVVEIGLETCNEDILRAYNKGITISQVDSALESLKENGVRAITNLVVGFPEETPETYENTLRYVSEKAESGLIMSVNPAIYTDYDSPDNLGEIDFPDTPAGRTGRIWWSELCEKFIKIFSGR